MSVNPDAGAPTSTAPSTSGTFDEAARSQSTRQSATVDRFRSILFLEEREPADSVSEPEFFPDLYLDQVVASVTAPYDEYHLRPFFYALPRTPTVIEYRQEIFQDLENPAIVDPIRTFAGQLTTMRQQLADANKRYYPRQKQWGIVASVETYCLAIESLTQGLESAPVASSGLKSFRDYLVAYQGSDTFQSLMKETRDLQVSLRQVSYRLELRDARIDVSRDIPELDYSEIVERTFAKFRQREERDYQFELPDSPDMDHVEAAVLDLVAQLHPATFQALEAYCGRRRNFVDDVIADFDREVHFYLGYLAHIHRLRRSGLSFCYPEVSTESKEIECREAFDLALAERLVEGVRGVVSNDLVLNESERVIVVSGANQGGKTTFARMCGQLHYLGRLGCPVPGKVARLWFFDQIFTHFEREEDLRTLHSKLEDDLTRIQAILERATSRSLLIMNESFSSATLHDALLLSREIMRRIVAKDLICIFVTFLDELASFGPSTVSMTSMVDQQNLTRRTFKVIRRPADGLAYAMALAAKHGLTYEGLMQRLGA